MSKELKDFKLTQFSHGAGCGCKISPAVLDQILKTSNKHFFPNLIVGYDHKDDAAVYDIGSGNAVISTTDFFMPIVDDAYDFGRIASVNAISDVYAMGGKPIMAIGILGWPIDKLPAELAALVLEGARAVCLEAGIPLAGGHSIDSPEPIFGLAVTGFVKVDRVKTNGNACSGDLIYLTKELGVGILTTAEKKGILKEEHKDLAKNSMLKLNRIGYTLSNEDYVHAMTDVTGFGLAGHLLEMCEASELGAEIHYVKLPLLDDSIHDYILKGSIPGGTIRNWKSYGEKIALAQESWLNIIADPQTSGGLLIAVDPVYKGAFDDLMNSNVCSAYCIGVFQKMEDRMEGKTIRVL
ncbi:MAG: selenide, water dikinase SelD [Saprospiraceae bacterium]